MSVGLPSWLIRVLGLIAPNHPAASRSSREQLDARAWAAGLYDRVNLIRLSRVLPLAGFQVIHLGPAGLKRSSILPSNAKQDHLRDVSKIESYSAAVATAILSDFAPDDVRFVLEPPRTHYAETLRQQSVRDPKV